MSTTRIGTNVGGYRLESLLGRGGMSVVYLAEHAHLGRKVALKLLTASLSVDESFRERFEQESQRAAALDHPNIVPIYDAGEIDGELYIAMKYVQGSDLKALIASDGPMGVGRVLFLLEQAAAALDAAHAEQLVHRDVKPANILVEDVADRVYVTDFGVVKHASSPGVTKAGLFIGTADYAAPEQIEGLPVDARTDVYALTCVLYECLTGQQPFARQAEVAVMHAHLTEPPPAVTTARPELPKAIDAVVARGMAKDPDGRYTTCQELVAAARAALLQQPTGEPAPVVPVEAAVAAPAAPAEAADESGSAQPPPDASRSAGQRGGRGRMAALILACSALAAAIAAVAVFLVTRSDDEQPAAAPPAAAAPAEADPAEAAPTPAEPAAEPAPGEAEPEPPSPPPAEPEPAPAEGGEDVPAAPEPPAEAPAPEEAPADGEPGTGPGALTDVEDPAELLASVIPPQIFETCTLAAEPSFGAVGTAVCVGDEEDGLRFSPDELEISVFATGRELDAAYESVFAGLPADEAPAADSGRCSGTQWLGEGEWEHGPDRPGGARLCAFAGDDVVIAWSHRKFGQEDHLNTLGVATEGGVNHTALFNWWRFWVHRIGLSG